MPRVEEKCSPEAHDCKISPGGKHAAGPLVVEHLWCFGARITMSEKGLLSDK